MNSLFKNFQPITKDYPLNARYFGYFMITVFYLVLLFLFIPSAYAMKLQREINLEGEWRFEIGDNEIYAQPDYDDSGWEKIKVPSAWENEGFPGYDGFAWYRISFKADKHLHTENLYLKMGRIDDVDRVYFNGKLIGGNGGFPPQYKSAFDVKRIYPVSSDLIILGKINTIAVRVYDKAGKGGIFDCDIGVYSRRDILDLQIDLSGAWRFSTGDDKEWAQPEFNDSIWAAINVPEHWETQGYSDYDGIAWYRQKIKIPKNLAGSKLILIMGKINNMDEVFFNGIRIGHTGDIPQNAQIKKKYKIYTDIERAYFIPPSLIRSDKNNTIAVRVFDSSGTGGIFDGYIGITTRDNYMRYIKK